MNLDGGLASIVTDRNREEARDPETPFSAFRTDMLYTVFGKLFQGQFSATTVNGGQAPSSWDVLYDHCRVFTELIAITAYRWRETAFVKRTHCPGEACQQFRLINEDGGIDPLSSLFTEEIASVHERLLPGTMVRISTTHDRFPNQMAMVVSVAKIRRQDGTYILDHTHSFYKCVILEDSRQVKSFATSDLRLPLPDTICRQSGNCLKSGEDDRYPSLTLCAQCWSSLDETYVEWTLLEQLKHSNMSKMSEDEVKGVLDQLLEILKQLNSPTLGGTLDKAKKIVTIQHVKSAQKEKIVKKYKLSIPMKERTLELFFREVLLLFGINNLDPSTYSVDTSEIMTLIVLCGNNRMFEDEVHAYQTWFAEVMGTESNTLMALLTLKKLISLSSNNDRVDWMYDVYSKYILVRQGPSETLQAYTRRYDEVVAWTQNEFRTKLSDKKLDMYLYLAKMNEPTYALVKRRFLTM